MKISVRFLILFLAIGLLNKSCQKDPVPIELPTTVEFGKSIVFLNGDVANFLPSFSNDTVNHILNIGFVEKVGTVSSSFGFAWLPLRVDDFKLVENPEFPGNYANPGFGQIVSEDLEGYSYKLSDAEEGFINIESLDTLKKEVSGRFQVRFCRTSKNGNRNLGLPKKLLFQGVFFEKYTQ